MAVTAKTPQEGTPPWRIEPDQPKDDGQSANDVRSRKKRKGASGDTWSANDDGKTTTKSRKRSSAEGHIDEDKAAGAKEARGGHERSTAPNSRKVSSTQSAETKNNVDGATPSPDGNAEHKFDVFFFLQMFYDGTVFKKGHQIFQRIFGRSKIFFFLHMFYEGIL